MNLELIDTFRSAVRCDWLSQQASSAINAIRDQSRYTVLTDAKEH